MTLVSEFALRILTSGDLEIKLESPPETPTDDRRTVVVPNRPQRSPDLTIRSAKQAPVPRIGAWQDPEQRRRLLHAFANHELQAVELYARALLLYVDAPDGFRRDLLHILLEEQSHTRVYLEALQLRGCRFGDLPVSGYFWHKAELLKTPLHFLAAMPLTFENANLDHSLEIKTIAENCNDPEGAALFDHIHRDEINHVAFGWRWLNRLAAAADPWEVFSSHLLPPLHAGRASGREFHPEPRRLAGMTDAFIEHLHHAHDSHQRLLRRRSAASRQ